MDAAEMLIRDLKERSSEYQSSVLKVVTAAQSDGTLGVWGKFSFLQEEATDEFTHSYDGMTVHKFTGEASDGVRVVESLIEEGLDALPFHLDEGSIDEVTLEGPDTYMGTSWPIPLGYGDRAAWPFIRYRFEGLPRPNLPSGPVLAPDLPVIVKPKFELENWLGIENKGLDKGGLVIELPDYRARIARIVVEEEMMLVETDGSIAQGDLQLRVAVTEGQDTSRELSVSESDTGFEVEHPDPQAYTYLFLLEEETADLIDWAQTNPYRSDLPQIEFTQSEQRVRGLVEGGETETVEFKQELDNGFTIIQSIVAFANLEGGAILIGVDDNGAIVGTDAAEDKEKIKEWVHGKCEPPVSVGYEIVNMGDQELLMVDVPEGANKPYQHRDNGIFYVRRGATDRPANRSEILELVNNDTVAPVRGY